MKYKIIYQTGPFYFEAEANSENERKEAIKGIIYATKDLLDNNLLHPEQTLQSVPVCYQETDVSNQEPEPVQLATDKQKRFMDKLGIQYASDITMVEASDYIRQWKAQNGYKV